MRSLPTPPACEEPATVRIELYSADSLDACAYTCPAHTIHVTAVVTKAGMTAHPVGMAPDIARPCGYVHVFPTGALATEPALRYRLASLFDLAARDVNRPESW